MLNGISDMLRQYRMVQPGDRVICAVSGGADSVALLFAMYLLKEKLGITLEAAHFNHGLRGEESNRDEAFVKALCERYDITLHLASGNVTAGKKGLEAAARDARYAFFATLPGKIATAHTADDNAETVLMHMVRGTGLKGLGAIAPMRDRLIRPMLLITRQQVLDFLEEYHLSYVTDSSNDTDQFLRNRLRQDEEALQPPVDFTDGLALDTVKNLPNAMRSRMIAAFLKHCGVKEPEAEHIALAEKLVFSDNPSAAGEFPGGVRISRCYDRLVKEEKKAIFSKVALNCPGVTEIPALGLRVECTQVRHEENTPATFTVAPVGQLWLRPRQAGDSIRLPGGSKSLKKLFIDRKIPAAQRLRIPVVCDEQGVLGVYGIGANHDRVAAQLQIRFQKIEK